MFETEFILQNYDEDIENNNEKKKFWFEVLSPLDGSSYCVDETGELNIPIEIVMMANYKENLKYKDVARDVNISFNFEKYVIDDFLSCENLDMIKIDEKELNAFSMDCGGKFDDMSILSSSSIDSYFSLKYDSEFDVFLPDESNVKISKCSSDLEEMVLS